MAQKKRDLPYIPPALISLPFDCPLFEGISIYKPYMPLKGPGLPAHVR